MTSRHGRRDQPPLLANGARKGAIVVRDEDGVALDRGRG